MSALAAGGHPLALTTIPRPRDKARCGRKRNRPAGIYAADSTAGPRGSKLPCRPLPASQLTPLLLQHRRRPQRGSGPKVPSYEGRWN
jgi:hypothetical protein